MSNTHHAIAHWTDKMQFDVELDGSVVHVDASPEHGGENQGPRPKTLLLAALAGCTGMDVVSILRKMRQPLAHFALRVEAHVTEGHPAVYDEIRLVYEFHAADGLDESKVRRAVELSQDKYCGVSAMLRKAAELRWEIRYV